MTDERLAARFLHAQVRVRQVDGVGARAFVERERGAGIERVDRDLGTELEAAGGKVTRERAAHDALATVLVHVLAELRDEDVVRIQRGGVGVPLVLPARGQARTARR